MGSNRYLVKPHGAEWIVEHNGTAIGTFETRERALEEASRLASTAAAELIIVGPDGTVESEERFGSSTDTDPVG